MLQVRSTVIREGETNRWSEMQLSACRSSLPAGHRAKPATAMESNTKAAAVGPVFAGTLLHLYGGLFGQYEG